MSQNSFTENVAKYVYGGFYFFRRFRLELFRIIRCHIKLTAMLYKTCFFFNEGMLETNLMLFLKCPSFAWLSFVFKETEK